MEIAETYSHLNGLEWMQAKSPARLREIRQIVKAVRASDHRVYPSQAKKNRGKLLYSPVALNKAFASAFERAEWKSSIAPYYLTRDPDLLRRCVNLPAPDQKRLLEEAGATIYRTSNQTDFLKNKVAVEVQFGHYTSIAYDLFVKHMAFYIADEIEVGVEIVPTKTMLSDMSSGPGSYEFALHCIVRQGRSLPGVPLVVLGIEP